MPNQNGRISENPYPGIFLPVKLRKSYQFNVKVKHVKSEELNSSVVAAYESPSVCCSGLTEAVLVEAAALGSALQQSGGKRSLATSADAALSAALRACFTVSEGGGSGSGRMDCVSGTAGDAAALKLLQSAGGPLWLRRVSQQ